MAKRRYVDIVCILFAVISGLFIIAFPMTNAFDMYNVPETMLQMITNSTLDTFEGVLTGSGPSSIDAEMGQAVKEALFGSDGEAATLIKTVKYIFLGFAAVLAVILQIWNGFRELEAGRDTPAEIVFKTIYKTVWVLFLMDALMRVIPHLITLASKINDGIVGAIGDGSDNPTVTITLEQICGSKPGFLASIGVALLLVLPWGFSMLMKGGAYMLSFSILIEIGIRQMFFPLALYDVYIEGTHSSGFRNIKKMLAAILRISAVLLICDLGKIIAGAISNNFGDGGLVAILQYLIVDLAINATALGLTQRSQEIINDALGA